MIHLRERYQMGGIHPLRDVVLLIIRRLGAPKHTHIAEGVAWSTDGSISPARLASGLILGRATVEVIPLFRLWWLNR
jgi:hypothetical protein